MRSDFVRCSISDACRFISGKMHSDVSYMSRSLRSSLVVKLKGMYDDYKKNDFVMRNADAEYFGLLIEAHSYDDDNNEVSSCDEIKYKVRSLNAWLLNRMEVFVKLRWDHVTVGELFLFRLMADERKEKGGEKYVDPVTKYIRDLITDEHKFIKSDNGECHEEFTEYYHCFSSWFN